MKFTKMHGLGNDYVYVDCIHQSVDDLPGLARRVSDRHFGVGSDGLICICPSETADFRMRMFNADGSEGEMCGNGIRCLGKFVYDKGRPTSGRSRWRRWQGKKRCTFPWRTAVFPRSRWTWVLRWWSHPSRST